MENKAVKTITITMTFENGETNDLVKDVEYVKDYIDEMKVALQAYVDVSVEENQVRCHLDGTMT